MGEGFAGEYVGGVCLLLQGSTNKVNSTERAENG